MSSGLLHYREWHGQFRRSGWSLWPIARVALATIFRRRLFWVLYGLSLLIFLMFFFGSLLLDWLEAQIPVTPIKVGNWQPDPERMAQLVRNGLRILNGSQETFAYFFIYQGSMVMIVLALAGSVLVGNDFTHRSLPFYLSKPLSRWHYIGGKCLAVAAIVFMLTTLPALVLFAQHGLGDWHFLVNPDFFTQDGGRGPAGWLLLAGIFGFGLVLACFLSVLLVAAASWMRRTMPLIMFWTTLFLFFRLLAGILVNGLQYDARWRLLDLWNDLCLVGVTCLGYDKPPGFLPSPQPAVWEIIGGFGINAAGQAGLVLLGVCILCLIYLNLRTRAVEVIR
ncbi:MAG TPA: ABC transporter permease subunit [Gemmataceae bacterium]|nr:ABC transporter permease subunit [Gemmataceae bacterium]